ncbi:MAG: PilZ domain-containing protein [Thioalkalivibrionaceae bacterium]
MAGSGLLRVRFIDKAALYNAYMPFLKNGGLFIAAPREHDPSKPMNYQLGDEVFLMLNLPDSTERQAVAGKVAWFTPPRAQGGLPLGIGVQFSPNDKGQTRRRIEDILGPMLQSDKRTATL